MTTNERQRLECAVAALKEATADGSRLRTVQKDLAEVTSSEIAALAQIARHHVADALLLLQRARTACYIDLCGGDLDQLAPEIREHVQDYPA